MITVYRSLVPVVEERVAQFHARQAREHDAIDAARGILATRAGFTLAGGTAIAFGIVMGPAAVAPSGLAILTAGAWIAAIVTPFVVRPYVLWRMACRLRDEPALTGDPHVDLMYLKGLDPLGELRARARRWEHASVALPFMSLLLLVPLTFECIIVAVSGTAGDRFGSGPMLLGMVASLPLIPLAYWASARRLRAERACLGA
jgi:hypothetical protein